MPAGILVDARSPPSRFACYACSVHLCALRRSDDSVRNRWKRLKEEDEEAEAGTLGGMEAQEDFKTGDGESSTRGQAGAKRHSKSVAEGPRKSTKTTSSHTKAERDTAGGDGEEQGQRVSWSQYEDQVIVRAVKELGPRWCAVAARLPARTDQAVRNRWNRLQQRARVQARTMLTPFGEEPLPGLRTPASIAG